MLPRLFYLNDVLVAPEFDPYDLSVKELATRSVIATYNSSNPLYTISLPASATSFINAILYALAVVALPSTWHRRLGHPGPDILS
jgi:hypothetical protein